MRPYHFLVALLCAGAAYSAGPNQKALTPDGIPPCSGMARWGPSRYLVTHDLKFGESGFRFGLISASSRLAYQGLECDWSAAGGESNDLESLAPLDGAPQEYLACESGYVQGNYGHLYLVHAQDSGLQVRARYAMPTGLQQEVEGLATLRLANNRWLVLLGGRGGRSEEPGRLYWGVLDRDRKEIDWPKQGVHGVEIQLPRRLGPFARTLSDMFVDDQKHLYISSCSTPGRLGPNRSLIFRAGAVHDNLKAPFRRATENQEVWWVDGCKVEGICPSDRPGYGPAYVTDDDDLGGLWRAVPTSPSLSY